MFKVYKTLNEANLFGIIIAFTILLNMKFRALFLRCNYI